MSEVKVAVVTGANKGIGYGIVKGLCEQFDGVVYLTARNVKRGKEAVEKLNKLNLKPEFHQLDINDPDSIKTFRDHLREKYGGIDVLVNNAAIAFTPEDTTPPEQQAKTTINVNFFGVVRVSKALFPLLRNHARVVNISSSWGFLSKIPGEAIREKLRDPQLNEDKLVNLVNQYIEDVKAGKDEENGWGKSAYVVSKVAVGALTIVQQKAFDLDPDRFGITVNAVHPGHVDTDMSKHLGSLSVEEGAVAPLYAALQPPDGKELKGKYIWHTKEVVDWYNDVPNDVVPDDEIPS